jgi:hypothetical protein
MAFLRSRFSGKGLKELEYCLCRAAADHGFDRAQLKLPQGDETKEKV